MENLVEFHDLHVMFDLREGTVTAVNGVTLNIPLFDLSRKGRVMQERAALNQQVIAVRNTMETVRFEVRAAILAVRNAARVNR